MDQRSGDGCFLGQVETPLVSLRNEFSNCRDAEREDCFYSEQSHPELPIQEESQHR